MQLALRSSTSVLQFQQCLRRAVKRKTLPLRGLPSHETHVRRKAAIVAFSSGVTEKASVLRSLQCVLANGDPLRVDKLEVFVDRLGLDSLPEDLMKQVVAHGLTAALFPCAPHQYPRHRWRGAKTAVDDIGCIEANSRLLTEALEDLSALRRGREKDKGALRSSFAGRDNTVLGSGGASVNAQGGDSARVIDDKSPEANEMYLRKALEFMRSNPLSRILRIRIVLQVLQHLVDRYFHIDSAEWELEQQCHLLSAAPGDKPQRHYKVTMLAHCAIENEAFVLLDEAFKAKQLWTLVPSDGKTNAYRCGSFRALSRSGGAIQEIHVRRNTAFAIRKYAVIHSPEVWKTLRLTPRCLIDRLSWESLGSSMDSDTLSEEVLDDLELDAQEAEITVGAIECKHAAIRRIVKTRSLQTHTIDMKSLNVEWVSLCIREVKVSRRLRKCLVRAARRKAAVIKD